jgi:hypothetical protein
MSNCQVENGMVIAISNLQRCTILWAANYAHKNCLDVSMITDIDGNILIRRKLYYL